MEHNEGWFDSTPPTPCPEDRLSPPEDGYICEVAPYEEPDTRHSCEWCGGLDYLEPVVDEDGEAWLVCLPCKRKAEGGIA